MSHEPVTGVPAADLSDADLERELRSLDRTRDDTIHQGSPSAVATHLRRTAELTEERAFRGLRETSPGTERR